jgi:endonuclease/exonuclease/phosphatase family metal-dependent hydrolase
MGRDLVVASFNVHAGVDAWGRPFDVTAAATSLGADVLLLQETWTPQGGIGIAPAIAAAIGGSAHETTLGEGRRALPHPRAPATWHRRWSRVDGDHAVFLDSVRPLRRSLAGSERYTTAEPGSLSLAIVSKLPVRSTAVFELPRLRRDRVRRTVLEAQLELDDEVLTVVCVHMSHLTHGSPRHFKALRAELDRLGGWRSTTVVGGDMNLWGPGVSLQLPRWRRAVKAKTWPAWRPHSQIDHLLVGHGLVVEGHRASGELGSDHLAVVARLRLR